MEEDNKGLLTRWDEQLAWKQKAHTDTARWVTLKTSWIGYPAAALSALAGTSIVASFAQGGSQSLQLAAIVLSLAAAVLSAIQAQTRTGFLELADRHRIAAARYGNLRREIERIKASPGMGGDEKKQRISSLQERFDRLDVRSPRIPAYAKKWWRAGKPPDEIAF